MFPMSSWQSCERLTFVLSPYTSGICICQFEHCGELSDPLFLLVLLWFCLSPLHSVVVLTSASFLNATIKSAVIVAWGFGQQELKASPARHVCRAMALVPVFLGTAQLRGFCSSTEGAAPAGVRWEWAALVGILCQRRWSALRAGRINACKLQPSDKKHACIWYGEC